MTYPRVEKPPVRLPHFCKCGAPMEKRLMISSCSVNGPTCTGGPVAPVRIGDLANVGK